MPVLENEFLRLVINADGALGEFTDRVSGHTYAGGGALWRLYFERGNQKDREIVGLGQRAEFLDAGADALRWRYACVNYGQEELAIGVEITVRLAGDQTHWAIALDNRQENLLLRECQFPLLRRLTLRPGQRLLWSQLGGELFDDLPAAIRKRHTEYKASDHLFLHLDCSYPGTLSTNCYVFTHPERSLYCACYDETFEHTLHFFRLYGEALECGFARYPSLAPGECARNGEFVLSPHAGDWHAAARKYRQWADRWFRPLPPPAWVRRMKGWQRIILKHQYGEVHYDYTQLPQIHAEGLQAGIDTLHLFGWWSGGMDNRNPDYVIDEAMGGEEVLRRNIADFQKNGAVILYSNGRLIDLETEYYAATGRRISVKDRFGAEIRDAYRFRASGTFTGHFGNRTFTAACSCCPEWTEKMKEVVDTAVRLGCKGVFFDQLGTGEFPCHDPAHGHRTPFLHSARQKAELTRLLRDYARAQNPEMSVGIELLSDISAANCDYVHSWPGYGEVQNDWLGKGEKPRHLLFPEWFRYCFPEIILTDRGIRDDTDIERRVNHALLLGLRSDVEIYRCRKTIAETPHYGAYLQQANQLRERYAEFLLEGRFADTDGLLLDHPDLEARVYVNGDRLAVVATQSHLPAAAATLRVPGYRLTEQGGLGAFRCVPGAAADTAHIGLDRHGLLVAVFTRDTPSPQPSLPAE